MASKHFLKGI